MNTFDLVEGLKQPSLWLHEQVWAQWVLLAIAASLSFLLLTLIARRRRATMAGAALAERPPERSLGGRVELIGTKPDHQSIGVSIVGRAIPAVLRRQNWAQTTTQLEYAHSAISQLRREIVRRDQAEARLEGELTALQAANERLRKRVAEGTEICERLKLKIAEPTKTEEQSRGQAAKPELPGRQEIDPGREDKHRVVVETEQKQCRRCKQKKARDQFHKNASSSDGLARWCKACKAEAAKEYRRRASASRASQRPSGICSDAPLCALHHRQADRLKRAARHHRQRDAGQSRKRTRRLKSPLSSPRLHSPKM
ncbi:MAG: hypothetical protein ACYS14_11600 [Planctomycetota bacterium]|jgi:hypothetical protein